MAELREGDHVVSDDSTIHLTDEVRTLEPGALLAQLRICDDPGCSTVLSRYNDQAGCSLHAPMVVPRMRGKVL